MSLLKIKLIKFNYCELIFSFISFKYIDIISI